MSDQNGIAPNAKRLLFAGFMAILAEGVGFGESTGLNYAYGTSLYGLKYRGHLKAGESLLVLGAGIAMIRRTPIPFLRCSRHARPYCRTKWRSSSNHAIGLTRRSTR